MKPRDVLLSVFLLAGVAVIADVYQAVATPEFAAAFGRWLRADALGLFVAGLGIAFFCALIAAAIQTAGNRHTQRRLAASREPHITRNDETGSRPAA